MPLRHGALILMTILSTVAAAGEPQHAPQDAAFERLEHAYVVYFLSRFPVVATYLGGSVFDATLADIDGQLRDYSPAALQSEDARWLELRAEFSALDPNRLDARHRIDRSVALAQIEFLLHQHRNLRHQERAIDSYVDEPFRGIDWHMQGMTPTGPATRGTDEEWQQLIARTRAIPGYLGIAEQQLATGVQAGRAPDWRVLREFGLESSAADAQYFATTLPGIAATSIAPPQRERLLAELRTACKAAAAAYRQLHNFIVATFFDDPAAVGAQALKAPYRADRYALGEAEYDWALRNNLQLATTAAELYAQSWSRVEATRGELARLAGQIAVSHRWELPEKGGALVRAVFDRLSENAPQSDAQMLESYRTTAARLVSYARQSGLFEVPADYRLEVTETPAPLQSSLDGAAYYPAPPFKNTGMGRFYVTPTGDDRAALRETHNFSAMADLAAHEGFPGHDWHYQVMTRYRDRISPIRFLTPGAVEDSSSMWEDSMAGEGWALYSEALLAEPQPGAAHGFYTPEEHLYELRGQLYRDLRVRIDTGIHTGRLSFEEAVTLFSEVVDFLPGSCTDPRALQLDAKRVSCNAARSAITRYARWPTQAITYRLGKDEILALRGRAQQMLGARFSLQRFHMEFMKQGTIPAGYFAAELLRALRSAP